MTTTDSNSRQTTRPMSADERAQLDALLRGALGSAQLRLRAYGNTAITWFVLMLAFFAAWGGLAWLARATLGFQAGFRSESAPLVLAAGAFVCAVAAWRTTRGAAVQARAYRASVAADLAAGVVEDTTLVLTAARRFQEPEHDGLIYFLRTDDARVYVVYDSESQDLALSGGDPLASSLRPGARLCIVRAPRSGYVHAQTFSGAALPLTEPEDLVVPPDAWPEGDAFCSVPWDALTAHYGAVAQAPDA